MPRSDAVPRRAEREIGYAAAAFGISHDEVRQVAYGRVRGRQTMPLPNREIARLRRLLRASAITKLSRRPREKSSRNFHIFTLAVRLISFYQATLLRTEKCISKP